MSSPPTPTEPAFSKVACDQCHRCKLRCTRELPRCERCSKIDSPCTFSTGKPIGKPKGSKNKNPRRSSLHKRMRSQTNTNPVWFAAEASKIQPLSQNINQENKQRLLSSGTIFLPGEGQDSDHHGTQRASSGSLSNSDSDPLSPSFQAQGFSQLPEFSPVMDGTLFTLPFENMLDLNTTESPVKTRPCSISSDTSICTCNGMTVQYVLTLLHEAQNQPSSSMLDSSLSLLRNTIKLCEKSLACEMCRQNNGPLLFMSLIQRAMSCYGKILAGYTTGQDAINGVVTVGGLEVDRNLQGKIIEAVIRSEIRAGVNLLTMYENILNHEHTARGGKVGAAEAQLVRALREEFDRF